jgi:hypothetical protein
MPAQVNNRTTTSTWPRWQATYLKIETLETGVGYQYSHSKIK